MPAMTAIAMNGVGVPKARFAGFRIDVMRGLVPADAVLLRLQNGGGKTTMITCLTAIYEPDVNRLEKDGRKVSDLFADGRIGIVAMEVTMPGPAQADLVDGPRRRVVGFAGRARRTESGGMDFERVYFSFIVTPTTRMDALPVERGRIRPASVKKFTDLLEEMKRADPACDLLHTRVQGEWRDFVEREVRIDLASSIHFMLNLNKRESGATSEILKRFRTDEDFLDFILTPIVGSANDPGLVETVRGTLRGHAEYHANRSLREFLGGSVSHMERIARAHADREAAEAARSEALRLYADIAAAIAARTAALRNEKTAAEAERTSVRDHIAALTERLGRERKERNWIEHRGLELAAEKTRAAAKEAEDCLTAADLAEKRRAAEIKAAAIITLDDSIAKLDDEIEREAAPLAKERRALADIGGRAAILLKGVLAEAVAERVAAESERDAARDLETAARERLAANAQSLKSAEGRLADISADEQRAADAYARLVAAGHLAEGDDARTARDEADSHRKATDGRRWNAEGALHEAQRVEAAAGRERDDADTGLAGADAALREADDRLARFEAFRGTVSERRFVQFIGGDAPDLYDPALRDAVDAARRRNETEAGRLADAVQENLRIVDVIDDDGLLPPTEEVDRTISRLNEKGINAQWMPRYLVEHERSPDEIRAALAADPAKFSGVRVLAADPDAVEVALRNLSGDPSIRVPVFVSADGRVGDARADAVAVVTPTPATYDREAADAERSRIIGRIEEDGRAIARLEEDAREAAGDLAELDAFVRDHPRGSDARLAAEADEAETARERAVERLHAAEAALSRRTEATALAADALEKAEEAAAAAVRRLDALSAYVTRWSEVLDELAAERERIAAATSHLREESEDLKAEAAADAARARDADTRARSADRRREDADTRLRAVPERDPEASLRPDDTVDALIEAYRIKADHVRRMEVGGDAVLARDREAAARQEKADEYRAVHAPLNDLDEVIADLRSDGRRPRERDIEPLSEAVRRATGEHEVAKRDADAAAREAREFAVEKELSRPDDAQGYDDPETCNSAVALRNDVVCGLERDGKALEGTLSGTEVAIERISGELAACEQQSRGIANTCRHYDLVVADGPDRPETSVRDLIEGEEDLKDRIRVAASRLQEADRAVQRAIRNHADFVTTYAGNRLVAETVAALDLRADESLGGRAAGLVDTERDLVKSVEQRLSDAEQDMENCRNVIWGYVDRIHDRIRSIEKLSVVPAGMGEWSGRAFVKVDLARELRDGHADVLKTRIRAWLEETIRDQEAGKPPPGDYVTLIKKIAKRVFGARSERAGVAEEESRRLVSFRTLRPATDWKVEYNPVSDLQKFSGGEKLLATLILFFVHMRVGMEARGRAGGDGMFLLLDNPVGEMNHSKLVRPALDMGAKMGIQMIGLTGINDNSVIGMFPLQIAIRQRRTATASYAEVTDVERPDGATNQNSHEFGRLQLR
ncbi:hypothetical protein [Caenispirillum salinarum]|uniref:hypothetical protein n=1 Tax=Caenispirillum salinarum TaxID=859058 RepID=UPI0038505111